MFASRSGRSRIRTLGRFDGPGSGQSTSAVDPKQNSVVNGFASLLPAQSFYLTVDIHTTSPMQLMGLLAS
jgi:hypothetical protein